MEKVNALALQATQKLDDTANRLEIQQDRLQQVTAELTLTQKSCDLLEDKLHQAIERAHRAEQEANLHKEIASQKSEALAKREAALAGLSMLMQEPMDQILQNVNDSLGSAGETLQTETTKDAIASDGEALDDSDSAAEPKSSPSEPTCLTKNNFKILPTA
jgi:hypothetical protein